jgi:outer membrane protein TolC
MEQARTRDLEEQAQLEVRLAIDALRSAEEQVKVAEEGLTLADAELAQARRRYQAGVTTSIEVTDAQARLARARDNRVAALYQYNQARLDYGQATGGIRRMLP